MMKITKETIAAICVFLLVGVAVFSVVIFNIIQQREVGIVMEREQDRNIMLQVCTDTPEGMINVAFLETQGISQADATRLLAQLTDCPERARVQALILPSNSERARFRRTLRSSYRELLNDGVISGKSIGGIEMDADTEFNNFPLDVLQQVIEHATRQD